MGRFGKGLTVALAALAMAAAGCGGGGDDDKNFDFNGTWAQTLRVVQSNVPSYPVGLTINVTEFITQSGTSISIASAGVATMTGTCDPKAGSYSVSAASGASVLQENGTKVDDDTMSGEYSQTSGSFQVRWTFTSQLTSRNRAAASAGAGGQKQAF